MVVRDLACHIDGFIAAVAHNNVLQEGPVTGRAADVIAAANTAAEVALRLVRPGKKMSHKEKIWTMPQMRWLHKLHQFRANKDNKGEA
ncbi:ERBB-3 BINDING PROTEIN [Trifolium repens]|nr:ERBB-3 BINDING PROTEIN [Trifolium repens]KAK2391389.1 ERBB-3 BINDING PROTEIN [Trifolium repens]